jgi:glycosyltransferase involved in cell wall biosynthesis
MFMPSTHCSLVAAGPDGVPQAIAPARLREVCLVEPRLPQQCKVASVSVGLSDALAAEFPELTCDVVNVDDLRDESHRSVNRRENSAAYRTAARLLNASNAEVVCLQYSPGIYGGPGGSHLTAFVQELKKPLVTVFHLIESDPGMEEHRVMESLFQKSARLVTMTQAGRDLLRECYHVPLRNIDVIPYGIPDRPPSHPVLCKQLTGLQGRQVLLTFGHLNPHKGVEHVIKALPAIIHQHPNALYVILGATGSAVLDADGESYRSRLEGLVHDSALDDHVLFVNRFMDADELDLYIGAADICLTPYDVESRTCSANLARMVGMGRVVISTPYSHAREMLAEGRGRLVRFASPVSISSAVLELLSDTALASGIQRRAWEYGRQMVWGTVARSYMECFESAVDRHEGLSPHRSMGQTRGAAPFLGAPDAVEQV